MTSPPRACHEGDIWEASIKSAILHVKLDYEDMLTVWIHTDTRFPFNITSIYWYRWLGSSNCGSFLNRSNTLFNTWNWPLQSSKSTPGVSTIPVPETSSLGEDTKEMWFRRCSGIASSSAGCLNWPRLAQWWCYKKMVPHPYIEGSELSIALVIVIRSQLPGVRWCKGQCGKCTFCHQKCNYCCESLVAVITKGRKFEWS